MSAILHTPGMTITIISSMAFGHSLGDLLRSLRSDQEIYSQQIGSTQATPRSAEMRAFGVDQSRTSSLVTILPNAAGAPAQRVQRSIRRMGLRRLHRANREPAFRLSASQTLARGPAASSSERLLLGEDEDFGDWDMDAFSGVDTDELLRFGAEDAEPSDSVSTLPLYYEEEAEWSDDPPPMYYRCTKIRGNGGCYRWCPFHGRFWRIRSVDRRNQERVAGNDDPPSAVNMRDTPSRKGSKTAAVSARLAQLLRPKRKNSL